MTDYQNFNSGMSPSQIRAAALQTHTDAAKRIDNIHAVPPLYVQRRASSITIGMHKQHERRVQAGGIPLVAFVLQEDGVFGDHLVCKDADGTIENIAKPWMFRRTPWVGKIETRNGVFVTYAFIQDDASMRRVRVSGNLEQQFVVPGYLAGDVIYAAPLKESDHVEIEDNVTARFVDANSDGRAWAAVRNL